MALVVLEPLVAAVPLTSAVMVQVPELLEVALEAAGIVAFVKVTLDVEKLVVAKVGEPSDASKHVVVTGPTAVIPAGRVSVRVGTVMAVRL